MRVGRHTLRGTPDQVLSSLEAAQVGDKSAERATSVLGTCGRALVLLGLSGGIGAELLQWRDPGLMMAGGVLLAGGFCLLLARGSAAHDLEDAKLAIPAEWLKVLKKDLDLGRPLELTLDFKDYCRKQFLLSRERVGLGNRTTVFRYRHPWLSCRGRLADGSSFDLTVERLVKRKERPKGKGVKVKEKVRERVTLKLRPDRSLYPNLEQASAFAGPPPPDLQLKGMKIKKKWIRASVVTPVNSNLKGEVLLQVFLWLYRGLRKAKASLLTA